MLMERIGLTIYELIKKSYNYERISWQTILRVTKIVADHLGIEEEKEAYH